jgi:integral membrane protein
MGSRKENAMTDPSTLTRNQALAQTALRQLRIAALVEGGTLAALVCIGLPLKYGAGLPQATAILGPIHGIAFLAYLWLVLSTRAELGWSGRALVRLILPAFIPFGTFFNIGFLRRKAA